MKSGSLKRLLLPVLLCTAATGAFFGLPRLLKRSATAESPAGSPRYTDEILQDLVPPLPAVADADNGWLLAKQLPPKKTPKASTAKGLMVIPGDEQFEESPGVDRNALAECLEKDVELVAMGRRVLQLPAWQRADWSAKDLMNGRYDARILFPAQVILAQAMAKALDGHVNEAWPDILLVIKAGHRISAAGGPAIDLLIGRTLFGNAVRTAAWAGKQSPDSATARRLAADLLAFEDCSAFYTRSVEGEVRWLRERNRLFASGGEPLEQALLDLYGGTEDPSGHTREQMQKAAQTDWGTASHALADVFNRARQVPVTTWADYRKSHPAAENEQSVEADLEPVFSFSYAIAIRSTASVRMARVSLLLRAWMYDHNGQLPKSLDALVPEYLPELPVDPFTGQPMRLNEEKLWCADVNLTDDGGETANGKDLVQEL